jgi:hypothetical protein
VTVVYGSEKYTHARTLLVTMSTPESRPDLVQRVTSESSAVPSEAPDSASETDSLASVPLALASVPELQQALQSALLQLEREKSARARLQVQLDRQTQLQGQLQVQAEQEEEYITNKLMKRLEALQQEKEELARQVEVEEEMITNALTKSRCWQKWAGCEEACLECRVLRQWGLLCANNNGGVRLGVHLGSTRDS